MGVEITRPDQVLILMRGIPGAGKSTKAKELLGNGVIHSADAVLESKGDYNEIFAEMKATKNYGKLFGAHMSCNRGAKKSMKEGITPVIIDNTNIKKTDMVSYVKAALTLGFDDANIQFVDIGTAGLSAVELAARNVHNVPLESIEKMIASHKGQGEITIETVMKAKDKTKESDVLYSCILLEEASQNVIFHNLRNEIPEGWTRLGHHMTINLGPLKDKSLLGRKEYLIVTHVGISDMAMAVKVKTDLKTKNDFAHVTVAINPDGGKPVMSNDITEWRETLVWILLGEVTEIKKSDPK